MAHAGIRENFKGGIWTGYTETITKLENIMVNLHKDKFSYDKFYCNMTNN